MCSVGLERLAYLLVAYGLGASAASLLGMLGLWLPRQVPLLSGAGLHLLLTLGLFFWAPKPRVLQHVWTLYLAAVLWGVGSGLNKTGLSSECCHGHGTAGQVGAQTQGGPSWALHTWQGNCGSCGLTGVASPVAIGGTGGGPVPWTSGGHPSWAWACDAAGSV